MLNPTRSEIAALVCVVSLLSGCEGFGGTQTTAAPAAPSAVWVQNPRAYWEEIAGASDHERERVRQQALEEFLKTPGAQQQIHLNLAFDATVASAADASLAADALTHALGNLSGLPPESRAVIMGLLMRMERRVEDLQAIASRESELTTQRHAYQALEKSKAAADIQHANTQKALRDAQAKLEALKSIEQTLESNPPTPTNEVETKPDDKQ
jgi:hypothetical protein